MEEQGNTGIVISETDKLTQFMGGSFVVNSRIKQAFNQAGIKMAYSEGSEEGPIGGQYFKTKN